MNTVVLVKPPLVLVSLSWQGAMENFRYFCSMKRFRSITILTLSAIAIMVAANVAYLYGLYGSIKEQSIQTATECLRRADILEIISRLKGTSHGKDDAFLRLTLMVEGEKSTDGIYKYPGLLENMEQTMSSYFHVIESTTPEMSERNASRLNEIFRQELADAGLYPENVVVTGAADNSYGNNQYWAITINDPEGKAMLHGYVSPLTGYVFHRMSGIIITSASILILMSFLIWYLLHWVGKLRTIEQMKDDFTHNMTHELKTPVAVAYSAADSMLRYYDQSDETRNKQFLTIIMQRLSFLSGMIENILSMSMARFKTMHLNVAPLELRPLVEEVSGMIELKASKPVNIKIDIPDNLMVSADSLHLGNVLSNLIDNAVKYSGESVDITVHADSCSITVEDNGIGIDRENLPYIFDKFYRVTFGDRYEVGGYGLGLFYVKQIVELFGWSIDVTSKKGQGTKFTIKIKGDEER